MKDIVFDLDMGSPFTEELDVAPNHEWRGLPLLQAPSDGSAGALLFDFIALRIRTVARDRPK